MLNISKLWEKKKEAKPLFDSIDNMPMRVFMDGYCDNNFTEINADKWDDVVNDYHECIGGESVKRQLQESAEMIDLEIRMTLAQKTINRMYQHYDKILFDFLKTLNFHINLPSPDLDNWGEYVEQITPFIKRAYVDYNSLLHQYKEKQERREYSGNKEVSRETFVNNMIQINSALQIGINYNSLVREYCCATVQTMLKQQAMERQYKNNIAA